MIYWFKNLPAKPLHGDTWKPVIPYKWLIKNFMVTVYVLQFSLIILFMLYLRNIPNVMNGDINPHSLSHEILSYISDNIFILIIAVFIIHELLHITVIFNKADFSITFSKLYFWINTNAELSKYRAFTFVFLPLFILTVTPFISSLFITNDLAYFFRIIAFLNLIISSADIINSTFIL
jgi:hypothetical protein